MIGLSSSRHGAGGANLEQDASLTGTGLIMGTVDFLSPEQSKDSKRADHRADIYSLGCTFHFLMTGQPPYPRETVMQRLLAHHQDEIPSLRDLRPETPRNLDDVFRRMMDKDPDRRPQSMAKVIAALEACRGGGPTGRFLMVFGDETTSKSGEVPAQSPPASSREPGSNQPPTWPADPDDEDDTDSSSYDLAPNRAPGAWTTRDAMPAGYGPTRTASPDSTPRPPRLRVAGIVLVVVVLGIAILAAAFGSRSKPGKATEAPAPIPRPA